MLVVFIAGGHGWYQQGPRRFDVSPGAAFVTAPFEVHDASGLGAAVGWVLEFTPEIIGMSVGPEGRFRADDGHPGWLSFLRPVCLARRVALPDDTADVWRRQCERLLFELTDRPVGYNQAVVAHLKLLLLDVARLVFPELGGASVRFEPVVAATFDFIEEHFADSISLDDVAYSISLSPAHLARLMRRLTGRSVNAWIIERRLVEARRLLVETDGKIEWVARRCGYSDPSHFRHQFRRAHETSPAAWRKANTFET